MSGWLETSDNCVANGGTQRSRIHAMIFKYRRGGREGICSDR